MKDRIKRIRKSLELTQQQFADRLGMKQNTIATYEMGRANPSEPTIISICREFNVNEDWLRYGKGEMFKPERSDEIDALVQKYDLTKTEQMLLEKWLKLPFENRKKALDFIKDVFLSSDETKKPPLKVIPAAGRGKGVTTENITPEQIEKSLNLPIDTDYDE